MSLLKLTLRILMGTDPVRVSILIIYKNNNWDLVKIKNVLYLSNNLHYKKFSTLGGLIFYFIDNSTKI